MTKAFAQNQNNTTATPKANLGTVQITTNFFRMNSDGTPKLDDRTGARFWSRVYGDGCTGLVGEVVKAKKVTKKGNDISEALVENRVSIRLSAEDCELLVNETTNLKGMGMKYTIQLTAEPHISRLDITNSMRGDNGKQTVITLWGKVVSKVEPVLSTLQAVGVDEDDADDILSALKEGKRQQKSRRANNLNQVSAARAGVTESVPQDLAF